MGVWIMNNKWLELNSEGIVVNMIVWDGTQPYFPKEFILFPCSEYPEVSYGWKLVDNQFIPPLDINEN
jgi:hypothetical protein